jgi:hypothetical protein
MNAALQTIDPNHPVDFVIIGVTQAGRVFRPSDWSERLAGVMAGFHPARSGSASPLGYSPWVQPGLRDGERCVTVCAALAAHEPMAYRFLLNFARDNELQVRAQTTGLPPT